MRGWRIAVLLAMAAALLAWAYLSLDRWQRGLIFHPNPYMVETPADRSLVFSEQRIDVEDGQLHGWWIPAASPKAVCWHAGLSKTACVLSKCSSEDGTPTMTISPE